MSILESIRFVAKSGLLLMAAVNSAPAQSEKPVPLNPKEISCTLVGVEVQGRASADSWGPMKRTVTSGTVGKLECKLGSDPRAKAREVPLASKSFTPSKGLETKDFGFIPIDFGSSMETLSYTLKMTAAQKAALKTFLEKSGT